MDGFFYGVLFGGLWSHRHETPEEKQARLQKTADRNYRRAHMVGAPAWRRARGLSYWQWCCLSIRHPLSSRKLPEVTQ